MSIYQDWTPVNIGNGKNKKAILKKQSQALPVKIDENEDPPKFVPFSQKLLDELAIQDLESGKCDFNSKRAKSLYVAIMKKLGVKTNMAALNNS